MFINTPFVSHAGVSLKWKIDCDDLTDDDLATLAHQVASQIQFSSVIGIPRGGVRFAAALQPYVSNVGGPRLIVDDVFTTGKSLHDVYEAGDIAVVIFARSEMIEWLPDWVFPIFVCNF